MAADYDTSTGLRALKGDSLVSDIDAGFLALATDVAAKVDLRGYATVATAETRTSSTPGDLATAGPSVTLTVPTNGLVACYVAVDMDPPVGVQASVDIAEDGTVVAGALNQAGLGEAFTVYSTPGSFNGTLARSLGGWLAFPATAGSHTYKLTYHTASGTTTFSNRRLWVRVLQP